MCIPVCVLIAQVCLLNVASLTVIHLRLSHPVNQSQVSGTLSTALPEDVFALLEAQLSLLDDYLRATNSIDTKKGDDLLVRAVLSIFENVKCQQVLHKETFLFELETCLAAANDFYRMAEKVDDLMGMLARRYPHMLVWRGVVGETKSIARKEAADLASMFTRDAVHAAERAVTFVMQSIRGSSISTGLFGREWEDVLVQNELAVAMVRTFDDYMKDIRCFLDQKYLFDKVVAASVRAAVCFYVQRLVNKADDLRRARIRAQWNVKKLSFLNPGRAVCRMNYDIDVIRDYFNCFAKESASLERVVTKELSVLVVILECMLIAVGQTKTENLEEFVLVVHKRTGANSAVTKHFLSDLWLLLGEKNEHRMVESAIETMSADLNLLTKGLEEKCRLDSRRSGTSLDHMLKSLYEDRIMYENTLCGSLVKEMKDLRDSNADNPFVQGERTKPSTFGSAWKPSMNALKGSLLKNHLFSDD